MKRKNATTDDRPPESVVAGSPAQLEALISPIRMELLEHFGVGGPTSIAEVAGRMGRAPDSLYYHVNKLVRVGLLRRVEERRTARRSEALFGLVARSIEVPRRPTSARTKALTRKAIDSVLRLAGRELRAAMEDETVDDEGPRRRLYGRRLTGRLTLAELREVNQHITAIESVYAGAASKARRRGGSVAITLVLSPVRGREEG